MIPIPYLHERPGSRVASEIGAFCCPEGTLHAMRWGKERCALAGRATLCAEKLAAGPTVARRKEWGTQNLCAARR
jgi:hypothetical protein